MMELLSTAEVGDMALEEEGMVNLLKWWRGRMMVCRVSGMGVVQAWGISGDTKSKI